MLSSFYAVLVTGLSLGLLHAFDADHVMAVTTLSSQKPSLKRSILFGLQWALGHGAVLMACGLLLFGLSIHLPETFVSLAETSVGVLLIIIGALCIQQCRKQKMRLVEHVHGDVTHTHWCIDEVEHSKKNEHAPVFVGMLHGLAGSAPALAVVPVLMQPNQGTDQLVVAMSYLLVFSLGVLISMTAFGAGLGVVQNKLKSIDARIFQFTRYGIGLGSMGLGTYWLMA